MPQYIFSLFYVLIALVLWGLVFIGWQGVQIIALTTDHSWGVRSQGAWHMRRRWIATCAICRPVDVVHFDVDKLKQYNAELGEEEVNRRLKIALRKQDIDRLQHGDECVAVVWSREGMSAARTIQGKLHEQGMSATIVVVRRTRKVRESVAYAVDVREGMKANGERGKIMEVER